MKYIEKFGRKVTDKQAFILEDKFDLEEYYLWPYKNCGITVGKEKVNLEAIVQFKEPDKVIMRSLRYYSGSGFEGVMNTTFDLQEAISMEKFTKDKICARMKLANMIK